MIEVRGPNVFQGLLADAGKDRRGAARRTASSSPAIWARSTRTATCTIVGRQKDLIISGGYNIYPKEIEAAARRRCPACWKAPSSACRIPISARRVVACGRARTGMRRSIPTRCRRDIAPHLARFKQPKRIDCRRRAAAQHDGQGAEERAAPDLRGCGWQRRVLRQRFQPCAGGPDARRAIM